MKILFLAFLAAYAHAKYSITDLLKPGTIQMELVTLGTDPAIKPLTEKFAAAMKNPELMKELIAKSKPGEGLPYDPRLGMTESEYRQMGEGLKKMKLVGLGKNVDLVVEQSNGMLTLKSEICSLLKNGAKIDLASNLLSLEGLAPIKASYFENRSTPLAPLDGYSWLDLNETTRRKAQLNVSRRVEEPFCLVSCDTFLPPATKETAMARYECATAAAVAPKAARSALDLLDPAAAKADGHQAPAPATPVASIKKIHLPPDAEAPACVQGWEPDEEQREAGAELIHDKDGKMQRILVPSPKPGARVINLNKLDFDDGYPARFSFSNGQPPRAFISVDQSPGSRLDKCLAELAKRAGDGESAIRRVATLGKDLMRSEPGGFSYDWDPKTFDYNPPEMEQVKHLVPGHLPVHTSVKYPIVPIESFLRVRRVGMYERTMLVSLLLKKMKIANRIRAGNDNKGYGRWWIELKDGRIFDVDNGKISASGPAPGFPGWIKAGDDFFLPVQAWTISSD